MLWIQNRIKRFLLVGLLGAFFLTLFFPSSSMAHRVTIFAWIDGTTIHTQSRFAGGRVVKNGNITVYDAKGEVILTGKTDIKGEFSFTLTDSVGARIVLDAGMGHGNEWVITAPDRRQGINLSQQIDNLAPAKEASKEMTSEEHNHGTIGMDREEVKAIIETTIDNKLKPIMNSIEQLSNKQPSLTDILGGIGYIFGLVGVAAYVHSRKQR